MASNKIRQILARITTACTYVAKRTDTVAPNLVPRQWNDKQIMDSIAHGIHFLERPEFAYMQKQRQHTKQQSDKQI